MATLGTQSISTSYNQVLKTFGSNIVDATMRAISSGDEAGVSALQICTTGAKSTGTFAVDGASTLLGAVTFGSHLTASTGTATIGTLSVGTESVGTSTTGISTISTATISTATISTATISTATISTATISTATISTATISTATISTATISTATISTATIPLQLGPVTFGTNVTMSTGVVTIGTESVGTSTIGTLSVTNTATLGSARIGATGPTITKFSFGTALFPLTVVGPYNSSGTSTGTFAVTGAQLGDYCAGSINSIGSATGAAGFYAVPSFYVISADTVRYAIAGPASQGTIGTGIVGATAWRVTA